MEELSLKIKDKAHELIELLGFSADPVVTTKERTYLVRFQLDDPSYLIGRQGEALESFQHLLRLLLHKDLEDNLIIVDINGYREKKTKNVEQRAREVAYQVRTTGKEVELPHLNSFERRIVHSIVSTIADVESESRGEGMERRVVIKAKKSKDLLK